MSAHSQDGSNWRRFFMQIIKTPSTNGESSRKDCGSRGNGIFGVNVSGHFIAIFSERKDDSLERIMSAIDENDTLTQDERSSLHSLLSKLKDAV
jgi:hypothetical protein